MTEHCELIVLTDDEIIAMGFKPWTGTTQGPPEDWVRGEKVLYQGGFVGLPKDEQSYHWERTTVDEDRELDIIGYPTAESICVPAEVPQLETGEDPLFDIELAKRGEWEKDAHGRATGNLGWNLITNVKWLALQGDRPDRLPCGMLTGEFLKLVAERFENHQMDARAKA
jgi:hypothetical protein